MTKRLFGNYTNEKNDFHFFLHRMMREAQKTLRLITSRNRSSSQECHRRAFFLHIIKRSIFSDLNSCFLDRETIEERE